MSRLEKKCLFASALSHGFFMLLFLFGSAFFMSRRPVIETPALRVVPTRLIDDALAGGGGNPRIAPSDAQQKGETLTPQPPAQAPAPPQPRQATPPTPPPPQARRDPRPEPVQPAPPQPNGKLPLKPVKDTAKAPANAKGDPKAPALELKEVVRNNADKERSRAEVEAQATAEANRRLANALRGTTQRLQEGFSKSTAVEVSGTGNEAYANYGAFVKEKYDSAWIVAQDVSDNNAVALVKVIIRRDGRVIDARILQRSGNPVLDKSVQRALDAVRFIAPFPEGSRDEERSFTIQFNLKSKRALG